MNVVLIVLISSYSMGVILFWVIHSSNLMPLSRKTLKDYLWGAVTCLVWPVAVYFYLENRRRKLLIISHYSLRLI